MTDAREFQDRLLSLGLARVSEAAALASARLIGRGDEKAADQAAVNAMLTGLSHCPQSSALHLAYARWLKSVNRMDESIAEFKRGHELRPTEASPLVELATTYLTTGRNGEALETLNQALVRQPDHPTALASLALIYINNGQETEARQRLEQVRRQRKITSELLERLRQSFQQKFGREP